MNTHTERDIFCSIKLLYISQFKLRIWCTKQIRVYFNLTICINLSIYVLPLCVTIKNTKRGFIMWDIKTYLSIGLSNKYSVIWVFNRFIDRDQSFSPGCFDIPFFFFFFILVIKMLGKEGRRTPKVMWMSCGWTEGRAIMDHTNHPPGNLFLSFWLTFLSSKK